VFRWYWSVTEPRKPPRPPPDGRTVQSRDIHPGFAARVTRSSLDPQRRNALLKDLWADLMRVGA
jgi:hypothetical protein